MVLGTNTAFFDLHVIDVMIIYIHCTRTFFMTFTKMKQISWDYMINNI